MTPLLALLLFVGPAADRPRLPPVDQCAALPGFSAFRDRLRNVTARQDVQGLLALTDRKILLSFGGDAGYEDMRRLWSLDHPQLSELWSRLDEALSLGCAISQSGAAVAPAMAQTLPDDVDVFDVVVATRPAVLRAAPDESAAAVAWLDWDLLTAEQGNEDSGWVKVRMQDGRAGFVRAEAVRSPIDYRATFERVDGAWRMTAFVAGD